MANHNCLLEHTGSFMYHNMFQVWSWGLFVVIANYCIVKFLSFNTKDQCLLSLHSRLLVGFELESSHLSAWKNGNILQFLCPWREGKPSPIWRRCPMNGGKSPKILVRTSGDQFECEMDLTTTSRIGTHMSATFREPCLFVYLFNNALTKIL